MAVKTKEQYESAYLSATGLYKDNDTGDITPGALRSGVQDLVDWSYSNNGRDIRITNADSPYAPSGVPLIFANSTAGRIYIDLPTGDYTYYKIINCGISGNLVTVSGTIYGDSYQNLNDGDVLEIDYNSTEGWW